MRTQRPVARCLLKARPTPTQLADRLAPPVPDGIELYMAPEDVDGEGWLERLRDAWASLDLPSGFTVVVEGPLRGLDGAYFDATVDSAANRELVSRLVDAAVALGAVAVNVHAIAPRRDFPQRYPIANQEAREAALPLLRYMTRCCIDRGLAPLIENIPPVARMREQSWVYTSLGMSADDMLWLCDRVDGLAVTLDVSHAGLYTNAATASLPVTEPELGSLVAALAATDEADALRRLPSATDRLVWYAHALAGLVRNVHVSNAQGLVGEGMPYGEGDFDLDAVLAPLAGTPALIVTETLEPDNDRAVLMREAQVRINRLLEAAREMP